MDLKAIAILILSVSMTWGYSLEKGEPRAPRATDFGETIKDLINNATVGLVNPIQLIEPGVGIHVNLTDILSGLDPPVTSIRGSMSVGMTAFVNGLSGVRVDKCSLVLDGILSPLPFDITLNVTSAYIGTSYTMDALVSNIIPVRGAGDLSVQLGRFGIRLNGKILNAIGKLRLGELVLGLDMSTLKLHFTGLLDNEELSEELSAVINQIVSPAAEFLLTPEGIITALTPLLEYFIQATFDNLGLTLSDLLPSQ